MAAFPQSHSGDVSPNTAGARCIDTGLPCDYETSTCNGEVCVYVCVCVCVFVWCVYMLVVWLMAASLHDGT